ncbi:MAG: alcohol dehydrogenase catalytic domain-containing protein [Egibacteraceae bacterium]
MRALVLDAVGVMSYRTDVPDPRVEKTTDAVVRVRRAGLCGSDLHPYEGREDVRFGVVAGHEAVGEIVALGADVASFGLGDNVIVPFTTSCGACPACRSGLTSRCRRGQLFGFGGPEAACPPTLQGGQAEFLRVPLAETTLLRIPEGLVDRDAVLLTDNLPTGWYAVERAQVGAGQEVAVVGLGAVGLCAVAAALHKGGDVIGLDPVEERRGRARSLGASALPADDAGVLAGRFAAVVDASGTTSGQTLAFSLVRPGGTLSVIAVQTATQFAFTPIAAYDANVTVRFGRAPVRAILDRLLAPIAAGELTVPGAVVVTDPKVPLKQGARTYARFAARTGGIVKALFVP